MQGKFPMVCPKCKKELTKTDIELKHIEYCDLWTKIDKIPEKDWKNMELHKLKANIG